jgi:hypothetical protein
VAAAAATATATSAAGEAPGWGRGTAVSGRGKDGKLDRGFLAGALGAGNFLQLVDDNLLKVFFAVFADVFVDGHWVPRSLVTFLIIAICWGNRALRACDSNGGISPFLVRRGAGYCSPQSAITAANIENWSTKAAATIKARTPLLPINATGIDAIEHQAANGGHGRMPMRVPPNNAPFL